jgi:hypothetical protein
MPRRILRRLGSLLTLGPQLQHLVAVQRCPPRAAAGCEFALRDELSDQRHMAAERSAAWARVIHTRSTLDPPKGERTASAGGAGPRVPRDVARQLVRPFSSTHATGHITGASLAIDPPSRY